jgi:hypothetical protein
MPTFRPRIICRLSVFCELGFYVLIRLKNGRWGSRDSETIWMTHLPPHLLDSAGKRGDRVQGNARAPPAFLLAANVGRFTTQAVTPTKHAAQAAVVALVFSSDPNKGSPVAEQENRCHQQE